MSHQSRAFCDACILYLGIRGVMRKLQGVDSGRSLSATRFLGVSLADIHGSPISCGETNTVDISDSILLALSDGQVSFRWRDSAHGNKKRIMSLPVDEFLRRFLLHLLPQGLANRQRTILQPRFFNLLQSAPHLITQGLQSPAHKRFRLARTAVEPCN